MNLRRRLAYDADGYWPLNIRLRRRRETHASELEREKVTVPDQGLRATACLDLISRGIGSKCWARRRRALGAKGWQFLVAVHLAVFASRKHGLAFRMFPCRTVAVPVMLTLIGRPEILALGKLSLVDLI